MLVLKRKEFSNKEQKKLRGVFDQLEILPDQRNMPRNIPIKYLTKEAVMKHEGRLNPARAGLSGFNQTYFFDGPEGKADFKKSLHSRITARGLANDKAALVQASKKYADDPEMFRKELNIKNINKWGKRAFDNYRTTHVD